MKYRYKKNIIKIMATTASLGFFTTGQCATKQTAGNEDLINVGGMFNNGDTLKYGNANHTITATAPTPTTVQAIDVNGKGGAEFIVNGLDVTIGSVVDSITNNKLLNIVLATNNTITFGGNALATIDATAAGGTIALSADSEITGAVTANDKTLTLNLNDRILKLTAGITAANLVDVTSKGTIDGKVTTTAIRSGAGNVTFTNDITATAANHLIITANDAGNLGLQNVTGAAGVQNVIFAAGAANSGAVTANKVSSAQHITINASNHGYTFASATTTANNGDVVVSDATKVVDLAKVDLNGNGALKIGAGAGGVKIGAGGITAGKVVFDAAGLLTLGGNVAGTVDATAAGGTIALSADSEITGAVTGHDMVFDLGKQTLTFNNGGGLTGDVKVKTTITGAPGTQGKIDVTGGILDLSAANTVTITITSDPGYTQGAAYPIIAAIGAGSVNFGGIIPTVADASPLIKWTQAPKGTVTENVPATGGGGGPIVVPTAPIAITPTFNVAAAEAIASQVVKEVNNIPGADITEADIKSLLDLEHNTGVIADGIYKLTVAIPGGETLVAALINIAAGGTSIYVPFTSTAPEVVKLQDVVSSRAYNVSLTKVASSEGISGGDETQDQRHGAWVMGVGSKGSQKAFGHTSAYKDKMLGAVIGADTKLNDNATVGFAAMKTESTVSQKGIRAGDKTKVPTWAMSLYGLYDFNNNWFVSGDVIYSDSSIHNKSKRVIGGNAGSILWGIADSKYHSKSIAADLSSGYNHVFGDSYSVTPSVGLSYSTGRDNAYKETGAGAFNYSFNKKTYNSTSGVAGLSLASNLVLNDLSIAPELRAQVRTRLSGKDPVVTSRLDGQATAFVTKSKAQKTSYSIGAGVNAKNGGIDFGAGYDAQISKKYLGHSGSLKVRVNF